MYKLFLLSAVVLLMPYIIDIVNCLQGIAGSGENFFTVSKPPKDLS